MDINNGKESDLRPGLQVPDKDHSAAEEARLRRHNLEFRIRYNTFLAEDCAEHYRRLSLGCSFLGVLFGFTAMTNLLDFIGPVAYGAIGFVSATLGLISVVYEFAPKAYRFANALRRYELLLGKLRFEENVEKMEELEREYDSVELDARINDITCADAYNRTVTQMGLDDSGNYRIGFIKYHTRFLFDWRVHR